jgi:hypothetical protein
MIQSHISGLWPNVHDTPQRILLSFLPGRPYTHPFFHLSIPLSTDSFSFIQLSNHPILRPSTHSSVHLPFLPSIFQFLRLSVESCVNRFILVHTSICPFLRPSSKSSVNPPNPPSVNSSFHPFIFQCSVFMYSPASIDSFLFIQPPIHSSVHQSKSSSVQPILRPSTQSSVRSFIQSSVHPSSPQTILRPSIHPFLRPSIHSSVLPTSPPSVDSFFCVSILSFRRSTHPLIQLSQNKAEQTVELNSEFHKTRVFLTSSVINISKKHHNHGVGYLHTRNPESLDLRIRKYVEIGRASCRERVSS